MHGKYGWKAACGLALAVVLFTVALSPVAGCGKKPQQEVWIIGLDGGDWDILEPVLAAGKMPNLKKLRDEGAWGRLRSEMPLLSPVLWTSIATGRTPDRHGVTWFMSTTDDGQKIPVSSRSRQVRAVWNVASENQVPVGVIGWWATWPVEPINGFMVSDYVGWHSFGVTGRGVEDAGKVWPETYAKDVAALLPAPESIPPSLVQRIVKLTDAQIAAATTAKDDPYSTPISHLRQAMATARGYTDIALDRLAKDRPRLLAVYYEGTDASMHLFNNFAPPKQEWVSDADYAAYNDAVASYWSWQDSLLGELLARRGPNTSIVICSDHGFRTGDERLREDHVDTELADASHMIDGILVLNGPGVRPGTPITGASIYDIAPTVMALLDLPVAGDLNGKALTGALTGEYRTAHPLREVATWETSPLQRSSEVVNDPEAAARMEQMLRSLGYVAGTEDKASSSGVAVGPENAVNLATIYMRQGKLAEAVKVIEAEYARSPVDRTVRLNLAQAWARSGRTPEALKMYRGLRVDEPRDLAVVEDYAHTLLSTGQFAHAVAVYDSGLAVDPKWAFGLAGKGYGLHRQGRSTEGAALVAQAQALDPRLPRACFYAGVIALETGNQEVARQQLTRALELDPVNEPAALAMSAVLLRADDVAGARGVLERTLSAAGHSPALEGQLGFVLMQSRLPAEAVPHLKAATDATVAAGRPDPALMGNLGVAQAMSGDLNGGIATFRHMTELWPDNAEAHGQLGGFLAQAGQKDAAVRSLERALQLSPGNPQLQQALAAVRAQ
jgi:predicted AlkP superfamily phosphohydrolase/phosphomutase/Flp pilus assembly protein TadD